MSLADDLLGRNKNKPKPKADFSNVRSGKADFSNVRSGSTSQAQARPAAAGTRTVVVAPGDSLSKIAKREYGDANQWTRIFEANRDVIKDPDLIHPGQKLRLP